MKTLIYIRYDTLGYCFFYIQETIPLTNNHIVYTKVRSLPYVHPLNPTFPHTSIHVYVLETLITLSTTPSTHMFLEGFLVE